MISGHPLVVECPNRFVDVCFPRLWDTVDVFGEMVVISPTAPTRPEDGGGHNHGREPCTRTTTLIGIVRTSHACCDGGPV